MGCIKEKEKRIRARELDNNNGSEAGIDKEDM